jgi:hypothetical protein
MKKMNKKGAEMTIGTLVVIILVLVVLVVVLFGFSTGWSNLWSKITSTFFPTKENTDNIVGGCKVSCASGAQSSYCSAKDLVFKSGTDLVTVNVNCQDIANARQDVTVIKPTGHVSVNLPNNTGLECSDIQC